MPLSTRPPRAPETRFSAEFSILKSKRYAVLSALKTFMRKNCRKAQKIRMYNVYRYRPKILIFWGKNLWNFWLFTILASANCRTPAGPAAQSAGDACTGPGPFGGAARALALRAMQHAPTRPPCGATWKNSWEKLCRAQIFMVLTVKEIRKFSKIKTDLEKSETKGPRIGPAKNWLQN